VRQVVLARCASAVVGFVAVLALWSLAGWNDGLAYGVLFAVLTIALGVPIDLVRRQRCLGM
jgi:hypothetical protein